MTEAKRDAWAHKVLGPHWARFPPLDPDEEGRRRLRQMVYMSHYGSDPIGSWDDRLVWELDDAQQELSRLIARENGEKVADP